ncbi:restriction endonuclease subunit S [Leuconostoc gasicomitatum]|jgi:Tfp pilus assembly protein PilP|uniref:restriction endonuclease subunit S n=1 Tax=Leuconostoc gasicomitatum TaxID=115778 RepID=UPI000744A7F4|nr:restriction endonuclease subunit S [Leuconostoc gasicomitatum]MBZ5972414.1 restriction endonuclease subunit S [Leuconostoc gasicomitatum]CUR64582.1 Type I restriction-modification system specificity subunit [Leuconostoc gasicomitatum KG16-1]
MTYNQKISELFSIKGGSPQVRIKVSKDFDAHRYIFYNQNHLLQDISQSEELENNIVEKSIKTKDMVEILTKNDLIISLISATGTKVSAQHQGYLISQNYVKLVPIDENVIDKNYLAYMLNESQVVKKQLYRQLQGSNFVKVTIAILKTLEIPMVSIEKQRQIGQLYVDSSRLSTLRKRVEVGKTHLMNEIIEKKITNYGL